MITNSGLQYKVHATLWNQLQYYPRITIMKIQCCKLSLHGACIYVNLSSLHDYTIEGYGLLMYIRCQFETGFYRLSTQNILFTYC